MSASFLSFQHERLRHGRADWFTRGLRSTCSSFCCAMLCISTTYMPSCCVRLSVRLSVMFVYFVETNKHLQKLFTVGQPHHSTFSIPNVMTIFRRGPPNCGKNRDFRPLSGFRIDHCWTVACCQHFDPGVQVIVFMRRLFPAIKKRYRATHQ